MKTIGTAFLDITHPKEMPGVALRSVRAPSDEAKARCFSESCSVPLADSADAVVKNKTAKAVTVLSDTCRIANPAIAAQYAGKSAPRAHELIAIRLDWTAFRVSYYVFIVGFILLFQAVMIPLCVLMGRTKKLTNTFPGVILIYLLHDKASDGLFLQPVHQDRQERSTKALVEFFIGTF
jgi:hypothetical protein